MNTETELSGQSKAVGIVGLHTVQSVERARRRCSVRSVQCSRRADELDEAQKKKEKNRQNATGQMAATWGTKPSRNR